MKEWSVRVESTVTATPSDDQIDELHTLLQQPFHASVGIERDGSVGVQMYVPAATIKSALNKATNAVSEALKQVGLTSWTSAIEAQSWDAFERQQETPNLPDLLGAKELAEELGVSKQRLSQLAAERSDWPVPVARLASGPVWAKPSVEAFVKKWPRKRTGRPKKIEA